ncbi:DEAD/DEAH box helicase [Lachnotalea glycerini]|uniref:Helicase n=1 Tax=Lachnotalea glycerini TaxID=1763509 RepID=A0A371JB92_9FIRM|nr:DEAD/DEAH box helicase [Lachnotalea glycerini]RDY30004.1 helicase [Lachnotalea glycerini]
MTWLESIVSRALNDPYLNELTRKLELKYAHIFLYQKDDIALSEKEFDDVLRFADILSRSSEAEGRNKAYKIVSLMFDTYKNNRQYQYYANSILTKLGNFASLNIAVQDSEKVDTLEIALEKEIKKVYQKVPFNDLIFTDPQYKLFEAMKDSNHFSFSGPTSFGKSFIMDAFIQHIITERHGIDNIVILVPTRALINQVTARLKKLITNKNYKVLSHPVVPTIYRNRMLKYIFVFTPERLVAYLGEKGNPVIHYIFIDEAHKIIAEKDSRSPLYYHAILLAERKSIKLYFASPNIPNADVFLQLFEKSADEQMTIRESPVAQNRFYIDYIEQKGRMFTETGEDIEFENLGKHEHGYVSVLLKRLGQNCKNIVYCNTVADTIDFALQFSKKLPERNDDRIDSLIDLIKKYVHKDYFLIDCLKKGVAFHFGRLPQRIRERTEKLFEDKVIDYMFCTSTLLEGVNLPAKNIFIFSNAIGNSKFSDVDFWNLAGRAGRLSKELSGNIICVRMEEKKNRWDNPEKDLEVVRNKKIQNVQPIVIKGQKNFYTNLEHSLKAKDFTRANYSQTEKEIWDHYANIVFTHQASKTDSILMSNFLKRNNDGKKMLEKMEKDNHIPLYIMEQCSNIKIAYQNDIWEQASDQEKAFPEEISTQTCQAVLEKMYGYYNWEEEESKGRNPMVKQKTRLQYFSVLMYSWMKSTPLNMMIINIINYYKKKGEIWNRNEIITFDSQNRHHINLIINNLISDIDNVLRYKIKNYFLNYYLIVSDKLGKEVAGPNWAEYVEYGTMDNVIIELQNIGLPRHLSMLIKDEYSEFLTFEDGNLVDIEAEGLLQSIDCNKYKDELYELKEIFS